ncbi:hypothetical protein Tco_0407874 [Tanacetum coccineum]
MGECSGPNFSLHMLVAKEENKVIMAETSKEFIEVLFSLMTMPIARVASLTRNCTPGDIGCVSNLYGSVKELDMRYLQGSKFLDILINPRSAAEIYCENLKLNLIGNGSYEYYECDDIECNAISYYNIGMCRCGEELKYKSSNGPSSKFYPDKKDGILKSTARFMITDDFKVMPVAMADMNLLNEFGKHGKIKERTIVIGREEILKLLECSFRSRTPLSETFLNQSNEKSSNEFLDMNYGLVRVNSTLKLYDLWKKRTDIRLKIIFDKVNNIALYAVVNEDFVNLLSTFLTVPLGYVFNQFTCSSFNGCLANLNKSILETDINLFTCNKKRDALVNPKLAPGLAYNTYLVGIQEATILSEYTPLFLTLSAKKRLTKYTSDKGDRNRPAKVFEGFIRGPATFLVMDNLEVKPFSPISVKLLVDKLMVPLSDLVEQEVILDEDKAMRLLAASLASKHALTATFVRKEPNVDCFDFLRNLLEGKGNGFKAC